MDEIFVYLGKVIFVGWMILRAFPVVRYIVIALNLIVFFLYFYDKQQAKKEGQRIPEIVLAAAAFFGPVGAVASMEIFRHKTKKRSFKLKALAAILLHIIIVMLFLAHEMQSILETGNYSFAS